MTTNEIYERQADGSVLLVRTEESTIEFTSVEDQIKSKEEELLKIYEELQALKSAE